MPQSCWWRNFEYAAWQSVLFCTDELLFSWHISYRFLTLTGRKMTRKQSCFTYLLDIWTKFGRNVRTKLSKHFCKLKKNSIWSPSYTEFSSRGLFWATRRIERWDVCWRRTVLECNCFSLQYSLIIDWKHVMVTVAGNCYSLRPTVVR